MSNLILLLISLLIVVFMLKFEGFIMPIIKLAMIVILIIISVFTLKFAFRDIYVLNDKNIVPVYGRNDFSSSIHYQNIGNNHMLIKSGRDFYKIYSLSYPPFKGYAANGNLVSEMGFMDELKVKLILISPLIFIFFIMLSERKYYQNVSFMKKRLLSRRDKSYIEASVLAEIKDLRERIEVAKTRKNEFKDLEIEVNKLSDKIKEEELRKYLDKLKEDIDEIKAESGFKTEFGKKLDLCNNFIEESLLRLDYDDFDIAIMTFNNGVENHLKGKLNSDEKLSQLVKDAHQNNIIDYDMMYDLNWIVNMRMDYMKNKKEIFPDIARMRKLIHRFSEFI